MGSPDCLDALTARYPGDAAWIERLHELDPTFREVCLDHHSVMASLSTLRRRAATTEREVELLDALLADLDGEIAQYLHTPRGEAMV